MTAYFNEFDPKAAAWLRELIRRGLIADGVVDERSILDVEPTDLAGFTQCHFFAGIGGWSLALRLARWPDSRPVWTGSPPCQPFSAAGRQLGKADERHLAPHFASLVAACQPPVLFGEQVASAAVFGKAAKRTGKAADGDAAPEWAWLDDLCERLEAAHYAVGASDIPAAGVGAAHIRQRTFFGAQRLDDPAGPRHDGSFVGAEGLARNETWLRLSGAGRDVDGLADADDARSQGRPGVPERADQLIAGAGGLEGGLEHGESDGRQQWRPEPSGRGAASGRGSVGLADADGGNACAEREQRSGQHGQQPQDGGVVHYGRPDEANSPWGTADWLFCRDGKWRPVGPSTFPLAHGLPARVGRLRGYGNAIVPQAAAEFIKAFDAASDECFRLTDVSGMTTDNNHEGVFG